METMATERGRPETIALDAQQVIEQVRDEAMFLLDPQGRIASWNEGVGRILGWAKADWVGQPLQVMFTAEDIEAGVPQAELRQAAATGRADDSRWLRRRNGERFFALGALTRLRDADGRLVGYLKALRDLTDSVLAREELEGELAGAGQARSWAEGQEAALAAAVEAIADGLLVAGQRGVQRCNAAALSMLGLQGVHDLQTDPETLVRRLRLRLERDGPLMDPAAAPLAPGMLARKQVLECWATQVGTGADIFLRCAAAPVVVEGRVVGRVVVLSDLSERLQLQQRGDDLNRVQTVLQERDAELRALVAGVRDYAIFTLDTAGRISSWYRGAELMNGYSADEAVGMPFARLFTPAEQASGQPQRELDIAAASGEYTGEGLRVRKDGSVFEAVVVLTALRSEQGELLGFIKLTQDVSQRRQAERQRDQMLQDAQAARAEAERLSHSKSEFLATISHELRTPLSALLGWAHVLERGVFDAETVKHGLSAISRNARVQVQLIEDLLDMSRIEAGQLRLDLQRIELGGVIAAAIDSALPAASAKGIGLRTVFGAEGGAVLGDSTRLAQVVGNLLSNAIKFTPEGGQISVSLRQHGGRAEISVTDTGQGIEPEFLTRMFNRFQQQDGTITRRQGGLGIGLAIVRNLVQLHGGSVGAHSPGPGLGATFTVTLPLADAGEAAPQPAGQPHRRRAGDGEALPLQPGADAAAGAHDQAGDGDAAARLDGVSVLLVDDEADLRTVTARVLEDAGAHVVAAASAGEALALLQQTRPQVLVSDIGMPRVDGYELIRQVRALPAEQGGHTPAASFTAYTRPEDEARALAAGFQLHLAKPVMPQVLVAAVARLAGRAPPEPGH